MKISSALTVSAALAVVSAQQVQWGQCGGIGWAGPTTCVSGCYCYFSNPYYSQCLAGTGGTTASTTKTTTPSTIKTSTTPITSSITTKMSTTSSSTKSTTTSSSKPSTTSSAPVSSGTSIISSYAKTDGLLFNINGKTGYFMGTNTYWIGFLTNNADVDTVMTHLAASGLKVLRVWGFNDVTTVPGSGTVWFQSFSGSSPTINTGANGLQRLDYVVQSAAAHGISLIINFTNNWTDYGGMTAYATYYGVPVTSFYTSAACQAQYQKYIAAVVSRYKTSTAIFAWELANEPRCAGCDTSVINTWATTTSAYIKSLDPNHMVTLGDEGFGLSTLSDGSYPFQYTAGGYNWTQNLQIPDIDFGTYHLYPSSWGTADSWGPLWIQAHAEAAAAVGKPVIMEEYGSNTVTDEVPWQAEVLATETAGDMYWQYGDTLSNGQTANDGYTIYYGTSTFTSQVVNHAAAMNAKAV